MTNEITPGRGHASRTAIETEGTIQEEKEVAVAIKEEKEEAIEEDAKEDGETVTDDSSAEANVQLRFISVCLQFFM